MTYSTKKEQPDPMATKRAADDDTSKDSKLAAAALALLGADDTKDNDRRLARDFLMKACGWSEAEVDEVDSKAPGKAAARAFIARKMGDAPVAVGPRVTGASRSVLELGPMTPAQARDWLAERGGAR